VRYLLCFVFPPLAVLACGRPFLAVLNFFLCLLLVVPGVLHALLVVTQTIGDERWKRRVR